MHTPSASLLRQSHRSAEPASSDVEHFIKTLREGSAGPHPYMILLGLTASDLPHLLRTIDKGFRFGVLERLHRNIDLPIDEIARLLRISPRTLSRRRKEGRFQPEESDKILRASRLFAKVIAFFEGDVAAARNWLTVPQIAFGGTTPLDVASTEVGSREVEALIERLEHGVYS